MRFPPRSMLIVLLLLPMLLALEGQDAYGQSNQLLEAQRSLLDAFQRVQTLDLQGVPSSETGKLVEQLNEALSALKVAEDLSGTNQTESDIYATLSASTSSQVLEDAQSVDANAQRQSALTQLTAYSAALVAGALSSLVLIDLDMLTRAFRRRKTESIGLEEQ